MEQFLGGGWTDCDVEQLVEQALADIENVIYFQYGKKGVGDKKCKAKMGEKLTGKLALSYDTGRTTGKEKD